MLHFNTSHVNVNHQKQIAFALNYTDFNTSHVNVNPWWHIHSNKGGGNFNTSHVNVNPYLLNQNASLRIFQYISC